MTEKLRNSTKIAFGIVLHKYRHQQHLSQEKLAELANLDRTYISQIERGLKSPSIQMLLALAQALHIKASILISEVENELDNIDSSTSNPGKAKE
jgi:transcriptional regulator with XRE-family HTH domain